VIVRFFNSPTRHLCQVASNKDAIAAAITLVEWPSRRQHKPAQAHQAQDFLSRKPRPAQSAPHGRSVTDDLHGM
jgi:hypothetical protein